MSAGLLALLTRTSFSTNVCLRHSRLLQVPHKHFQRVSVKFGTTDRKWCGSRKRPRYWDLDPRTMDTEDWLHIQNGRYKVCAWAISGVESCVVVANQHFSLAFDMGYAMRPAVKCQHVFISHGHTDHVAGVISHASKRGLYGMPPATYYLPPHLVEPLQNIAENFSIMNQNPIKLKLRGVTPEDTVQLPGGIEVQPFSTKHRVPSQGYIVYRLKKSLKPQYQGQSPQAIAELRKAGTDIFDTQRLPEVAYTGDTMSDIFDKPENPDLLRVPLLITEATYIDDQDHGPSNVEKARQRGHTHVNELIAREQLFHNVQDIVLVHLSDKYSIQYIHRQLDSKLPASMKAKVHLGLALQQKFDSRR